MHPIKASIGWSRGTGLISRLIMRLDRGYFSHVYFRFDFDSGSLIYESHLSGGVQITPYEHLLSAKTKGKVSRTHEVDLGLEPEQVQLLWNDCIPLHGSGYDARQILLYYIWIRLCGRKGKRFLYLNRRDKFTCNEFVICAGRQTVSKLGNLDYSYTPEALFRVFNGQGSRDMFGVIEHS